MIIFVYANVIPIRNCNNKWRPPFGSESIENIIIAKWNGNKTTETGYWFGDVAYVTFGVMWCLFIDCNDWTRHKVDYKWIKMLANRRIKFKFSICERPSLDRRTKQSSYFLLISFSMGHKFLAMIKHHVMMVYIWLSLKPFQSLRIAIWIMSRNYIEERGSRDSHQ